MVRYDRVTKRFPNGVTAVNGVTLEFDAQRVCVVLGPSGAGKSTLLRLANGLETPTEGSVYVGEQPVVPKSFRPIRREVGMIFQQFNLVPRLSVLANVLCGRLAHRSWLTSLFFAFPHSDFELAFEALRAVGLQGREWERAERLSGGQQQRVAIARTLVQQPKVILADEPVASLDPATSEEVLRLLVQVARERGVGVVINLHQVELARMFADRIVGIKQGQVVFDIDPDELDEKKTRELYGP